MSTENNEQSPTTEQKLDKLVKDMAELKEEFKASFPEKDADEAAKAAADKEAADKEAAEKAKGKAMPDGAAPPFGAKPDDEEEDEEAKAKKAATDKEDAEKEAAKKAAVEKSQQPLPWPRDMASKDFREGRIEKRDPAREFGSDPTG